MKKVSLMIVSLLLATITFAQTISSKQVPTGVQATFKKEYPAVKTVKWNKEDSNYEASFDLNGLDNSALISASGSILEIESEIKELPKDVLAAVKAKYPNQKFLEIAKITDSKSVVTYEIEIKGKDLIFDNKGKLLKEIKK